MTSIKKYRRGFLFINRNMLVNTKEIPEHLKKIEFNETYDIYSDIDNDVQIIRRNNIVVSIIGICMDTSDYSMQKLSIIGKIIDNLSSDNLKGVDSENFLDYIDNLSGRFVIIICINSKIVIFNDACGTKTVYYHKMHQIVSSHYNLIKDLIPLEPLPLFEKFLQYNKEQICNKKQAAWCLPGSLTPFKDVELLVCNHYLHLNSHKIKRFFPRKEKPKTKVLDVVKFIAEKISKSLKCLHKNNFELYLSLTAGNDSRMSLSAAKDIREHINFFTYFNSDSLVKKNNDYTYQDKDTLESLDFATKLAEKFNLNFSSIDFKSKLSVYEDNLLYKNHYHGHLHGLITGFREKININTHKSIHIRTNITELLRKSYFVLNPNTSYIEISKKMAIWSMYDKKQLIFNDIANYYLDWVKEQNFDGIYNYEIGDMFYWEYRMNYWLSAVLINQDTIFDTFILFNNRKILEYGMSIPDTLKENNELVYLIQKQLWPELLELCHPNLPIQSEELQDYFKTNVCGMLNFTTINYKLKNSSKNCLPYMHLYLNGCLFGFSNNYVEKNDYVILEIPLNMEKDYIYYLDLSIITVFNSLANDIISYDVSINGQLIFHSTTNYFCRPNQLIYTFKVDELIDNSLKIKILANKSADFFNGFIDIEHIVFRKEKLFCGDFKSQFFSSQQLKPNI